MSVESPEKYFLNFFVTVAATFLSQSARLFLFGNGKGIIQWILRGILCGCIFIVIHGIVFFRTDEFQYFAGLLKGTLTGRKRRG